MIGSRLPKHKRFQYEPRFWNPQKEEREGHKIKFDGTYRKRKARQQSLIWLIVLFAIVIYFIQFLSRLGR